MSGARLLEQLSRDLAGIHDQVVPALVQVRRGGRSIGAGTIWSVDGLIVTNAHVVAGRARVADDLVVQLHDGSSHPAVVVAQDPRRDLAALRVQARDLTPVLLGKSGTLRPGTLVLAFGYPYGVEYGATSGTVIGVSRPRAADGQSWLSAGLHLRPGHSGGPMVDAAGRLVGINAIMQGPDVGVAVAVDAARGFLAEVTGRGGDSHRPTRGLGAVSWV